MNSANSISKFSISGKRIVGLLIFAGLMAAILIGAGLLDRPTPPGVGDMSDLALDDQAEMAIQQGDWHWAGTVFEQMLDADPFDARSMYYLAYSYRKQGRYQDSRTWFEKAMRYHTYRLSSRYWMACNSALEDKPQQALEELKMAIDNGFTTRRGIGSIADLASLREMKEFQLLVEAEKENREKRRRR